MRLPTSGRYTRLLEPIVAKLQRMTTEPQAVGLAGATEILEDVSVGAPRANLSLAWAGLRPACVIGTHVTSVIRGARGMGHGVGAVAGPLPTPR